MSISDLIASPDVEKKSWAKDEWSKWAEGQTSASMVHQPQWHGKGKGKAKQNQNNNKPKQTTSFKKKKKNKEDEVCFVCRSLDHWAKKCPNCKGRKPQPEQKTVNMDISSYGDGTSGYGNLPYVSIYHLVASFWCKRSCVFWYFAILFLPGHPGFLGDDGEWVTCFWS
jgi:hypothetical protein